MPLTITAEQRDVLYDEILTHLSGIGDIELAMSKKDYETAQRLGLAFSDELRLLTELRRALGRLRDSALTADAVEEEERAELRENAERNHLIVAACRQVLAELDES